eukprot:13369937-Alexandrium_andersonii.AAC.1
MGPGSSSFERLKQSCIYHVPRAPQVLRAPRAPRTGGGAPGGLRCGGTAVLEGAELYADSHPI